MSVLLLITSQYTFHYVQPNYKKDTSKEKLETETETPSAVAETDPLPAITDPPKIFEDKSEESTQDMKPLVLTEEVIDETSVVKQNQNQSKHIVSQLQKLQNQRARASRARQPVGRVVFAVCFVDFVCGCADDLPSNFFWQGVGWQKVSQRKGISHKNTWKETSKRKVNISFLFSNLLLPLDTVVHVG